MSPRSALYARPIGYASEAALTATGHGGVLPLHRHVEQRSTCGTPLYCSREPNARLDVVPPLGGADGLVADVGIYLAGELLVAQALSHDGCRCVVEPLGRGQASQLCGVAGKALAQDAPQLGWRQVKDGLLSALDGDVLLVAPVGVVQDGRDQTSPKQRATDLIQRQMMQPAPVAQAQRRQPGVEHDEQNTDQGE